MIYKLLERAVTEQVEKSDCVMGLAFKDLTNGHEFTIEGDTVFPIGSSIKIAILLEFFKQARAGKVSVNDRVWVEKEHKIGGS